MEGPGSVQIMMDSDPDSGGPKHTDPADPDPQLWFKGYHFARL
jgi:hypothetical protein